MEERSANSANATTQRQVSSSEPISPADLRPFKDPAKGLDEVTKQLESDEWYGFFVLHYTLCSSSYHSINC